MLLAGNLPDRAAGSALPACLRLACRLTRRPTRLQWYMTPEVTPAGQRRRPRALRVYRATTFPTAWKLHTPLLLEAPLAGASLVRHNHKWWLIGHQLGKGLGGHAACMPVCLPTSLSICLLGCPPLWLPAMQG